MSCGAGRDIVAADARDRIDADCEVVSRRIHRDRHSNGDSQHESEVEPDSQTVGLTTVSVFQVGRIRAGGAASIGFATSRDGGRTWREGILPGLTSSSVPPGPSARASDPVVAWDAVHGVWLANSLALAPGASRLTIHRSTDGVTWTAPIEAAHVEQQNLGYDKNWLTCDNGPASPFRGRCYLAYTLVGDPRDDLAVQRSDDGGRTWSAAVTAPHARHRRHPGRAPGRHARAPVLVGAHRDARGRLPGRRRHPRQPDPDLRAPRERRQAAARPAADRRRRRSGRAASSPSGRTAASGAGATGTTSSSPSPPDGKSWSEPVRVTRGRNIAIPTIGIEPVTGRLAIAYYVIRSGGVDAELITSANAGRTWSAPQRLTPRTMPLVWMPDTTLGRMLADYIGVSWSRGRPLVVYALASPPSNGKLRQAIYAARG